ncbi:DUF732 domain-containing protein [Mycobacterium decipiens]|uniref:DUF732 domain-containing protein n=1 Tax=Mycobacterium decipiens TaxID=1430326 RepID=A0A1X2LPE3_9MYCO|nr:DUF732 domain-containing protein [Mycobacterium decipiens]OSC37446.1 hypothetical protein B8W66_21440 [Mycobacterium decipiens]
MFISDFTAEDAHPPPLWDDQGGMRLFLLPTVISLAAMIGTAAPAYADSKDDEFIASLDAAGLTYPDPGRAIAAGKAVCKWADAGKGAVEVVSEVQNANPGLHGDSAARFLAIAANVYCPKALWGGSGKGGRG